MIPVMGCAVQFTGTVLQAPVFKEDDVAGAVAISRCCKIFWLLIWMTPSFRDLRNGFFQQDGVPPHDATIA